MEDLLESTKNPKDWTPQGNYLKIKTTETIPFCNGKLEVGTGTLEYRIILAQLEILGIPYLDALEKQNVLLEHKEEIRKLLIESQST